jgi:hypothetical protein
MLTLRPARPDDAATILELVRALADEARRIHGRRVKCRKVAKVRL